MTLSFYLNMADAENEDFLDKLGKYNGPKNHRDLAVGGEYFVLPNFNEYKVDFKMSNGFFHSVHSSATL